MAIETVTINVRSASNQIEYKVVLQWKENDGRVNTSTYHFPDMAAVTMYIGTIHPLDIVNIEITPQLVKAAKIENLQIDSDNGNGVLDGKFTVDAIEHAFHYFWEAGHPIPYVNISKTVTRQSGSSHNRRCTNDSVRHALIVALKKRPEFKYAVRQAA